MSKWNKVKLGNLAQINPPKNQLLSALEGENISFIGMADVSESGEIHTDNIKSYEEVKTGYTYFQENDILFAKITPCMENGKGAIARNLHNGLAAGSTEFHIIRVNPSLADTKFISKILASKILRKEAEKKMTGSAGQKRVPKEFLENYKIPLPPIEEQKRIAEILDKVSNLISLRKNQIEKLDLLVKARFLDMFGDIVHGDQYPRNKLKNVAEIGSSKRIYANEYVPEGVPFYRSKEIRELGSRLAPSIELYISQEKYDEVKGKYGVPKRGDILIAAIGATIGYMWAVNTDAPFYYKDGNLILISNVKGLNSYYLNHSLGLLIEEYKKTNVAGSAQLALTIEKVQEMSIVCPPIELQNDFSDFVQQVEKQKEQLQQGLEKLELTYKALMQQYFN